MAEFQDKKIILVPQGCYGVINKDTPEDVIGLYTTGIATCSGLICGNDKQEYQFLAHIDESTLLGTTEENNELIKWLKKIMKLDVNFDEINLNISKAQNPSVDYKELVEKLKISIEATIPKLKDKVNIRQIYEHTDVIDCFVLRGDCLKRLVEEKIEDLDKQTKKTGQSTFKKNAISTQKSTLETKIHNGEPLQFVLEKHDFIFQKLGIEFDNSTSSAQEYYKLVSSCKKYSNPLIECYDGNNIISYDKRIKAIINNSKEHVHDIGAGIK